MTPQFYINNLLDKGYTEIGSGAYCRVFSKPEDETVIKISSKPSNKMDGTYYYLEKIQSRTESCFPQIYKLKKFDNFYICIMEKLEKIDKCNDKNIELVLKLNKYRKDDYTIKLEFLKEFNFYPAYQIVKDIIENQTKTYKGQFPYFIDVSTKNIMLRDKNFVLTDPIA